MLGPLPHTTRASWKSKPGPKQGVAASRARSAAHLAAAGVLKHIGAIPGGGNGGDGLCVHGGDGLRGLLRKGSGRLRGPWGVVKGIAAVVNEGLGRLLDHQRDGLRLLRCGGGGNLLAAAQSGGVWSWRRRRRCTGTSQAREAAFFGVLTSTGAGTAGCT